MNCAYMSIAVAAMGSAEQPVLLEGGSAKASKLFLKGGKVHVRIASGVTWSSICCLNVVELGIRHVHPWLMTSRYIHGVAGGKIGFLS